MIPSKETLGVLWRKVSLWVLFVAVAFGAIVGAYGFKAITHTNSTVSQHNTQINTAATDSKKAAADAKEALRILQEQATFAFWLIRAQNATYQCAHTPVCPPLPPLPHFAGIP